MAGNKKERQPGVWRLRAYTGRSDTGSPMFKSVTFRGGVRAAEKALAALVKETEKPETEPVENGTKSVSDLLAQWLTHLESLGRSPTTLREYRRLITQVVIPAIGSIELNKLTSLDLDKLYASLTARGLKATSVRRVHALLSASLHQAEKWDLVDDNVARRATPPRVDSAQVTAPSPEDVRALITAAEAVEPMFGALIRLTAMTGCRRGEICGLRWTDVDWQAGTLTVARSVYETQDGGWAVKLTKTHAARSVALSDVDVELLRAHRMATEAQAADLALIVPPGAFLFSRSPQGLEPIRPDVVTKFVLRISGGAVHLHQLRHFSASQMIGAGVDVRTVAGRLGHKDASVTLRTYSHVLPERDRQAAELMGRTLELPAS